MRTWLSAIVSMSMLSACLFVPPTTVSASEDGAVDQARIVDIFGRELNQYGIELVDWQGYLANPYVKLNVEPPANAAYPLTLELNARGTSRLMMDRPSTLSATGAEKTLTFDNADEVKPFLLEIHPDRIGGHGEIEHYKLDVTITEADGATHQQSTPIRVLDQDDEQETTFPLKFDYRYDTIQPYFSDPAIREAGERAIKDWFYFFDMQPFDTVPAGDETASIPEDNFEGHIQVANDEPYNGMWIYLRGLNGPHSTGGATENGKYHKRNGRTIPDKIHRSLLTILDFYDTATPFTSLDDEQWYLTEMNDTSTDVYGLIMHEFGHALVYSGSWKGVSAYKRDGGTAANIVAYQGNPVPLDDGYHIPGEPQYWDRISGQNGGRTHLFHNKRWMLTKLTLLIAEKAGWKLNQKLTPFLSPAIKNVPVPHAKPGEKYELQLKAEGGVPFYDWTITAGALPEGLKLDRFTGKLSGKVAGNAKGSYSFTVQLRDYDEMSKPITKTFTLYVGSGELAGSYLFDEEGALGLDYSGAGHDGTMHDAVRTAGARDGGALLNGTTSYIELPEQVLKDADGFTFTSWIKPAAIDSVSTLFDFKSEAGGMALAVDEQDVLRFNASPNNGKHISISGGKAASEEWHHAAVAVTGNSAILYVDGKESARSSDIPSGLLSVVKNGGAKLIGKSHANKDYYKGVLDEAKLYNRALSAAEIAALAADKPIPPEVEEPDPVNPNAAVDADVSTSFVSAWESLVGINDEYEPASSADRNHPIYGNWDTHGTTQWVQYEFAQPVALASSHLYWFDDNDGIDTPESYLLEYWDGSAWKEVPNPSQYGVLPDQYNVTTFDPVTTNKIRVQIQAKPTTSTGIQQWKVMRADETARNALTITGPSSVKSGQSFDVQAGLRGVDGDTLAADMTIQYDADRLELADTDLAAKNEAFKLVGQHLQPGSIRLLFAKLGTDAKEVNGKLIELRFKAKSGSSGGVASVSLTNGSAADGSGTETALTGAALSITVDAIDPSALVSLITDAEQKLAAASVGSGVGQVPQAAKTAFEQAIQSAKAVADDANPTQPQIENAIRELQTAIVTFEAAIIKTTPGDINDDARISIGDLALVAAAYGKSAEDRDWANVKKSDVNQDGKIDIEDLAALARLILA
ncbi:LamG-like jellyroll fold domain-containing protein [Paenibacillus methanolicus]|uniref:Cohesin domain-containing protein n=1 Tax=Paenibacillus methanolicus TaxID=582686 RepID=A0A5S5CGM1_9BACL|nr:LamG-like jellyroll fold domain-containing protein [Paenibacillus methanolicus]TYP78926.1 cohesin domain-containing protein [Paenibacillus methanolicus]